MVAVCSKCGTPKVVFETYATTGQREQFCAEHSPLSMTGLIQAWQARAEAAEERVRHLLVPVRKFACSCNPQMEQCFKCLHDHHEHESVKLYQRAEAAEKASRQWEANHEQVVTKYRKLQRIHKEARATIEVLVDALIQIVVDIDDPHPRNATHEGFRKSMDSCRDAALKVVQKHGEMKTLTPTSALNEAARAVVDALRHERTVCSWSCLAKDHLSSYDALAAYDALLKETEHA